MLGIVWGGGATWTDVRSGGLQKILVLVETRAGVATELG